MAKGKIHHKWWKGGLLFLASLIPALMLISPLFGIMTLMGYLLGAVIEPDLDHLNMTHTEYMMMRKFGCFGSLFVAAWTPYAYIFPHRSFWSHFPVVSDLIRLSYLLTIPAVLYLWYGFPVNNTVLVMLAGTLAGLSISTTIHYVLDWKKK